MKKFLSSLAVFFLISSGAFALSDSEYKEMMKDSEFADAEKELAQSWSEAKKLPAKFFEHLQKEQREWVSHGRDKRAESLMKADKSLSRTQAYAQETGSRVEAINSAIDAANLTAEKLADGFFINNDSGKYIELSIHAEGENLTAEFTGKDGNTIWKADGKISGNVLILSGEKGSAAITFWNMSYPVVVCDKSLKDSGINVDGKYHERVTAF